MNTPPDSLEDQIAEVKREIRQREFVYPKWVAQSRMTQAASDKQLGRMRSVLATLEKLKSEQQGGLF